MSNGEPVEGARRRVLVGVDGSDDGLRAVRYALREALATDSDLWIVNVADASALVGGLWDIVVPIDEIRQIGESFVKDALEVAGTEGFPAERVTTQVVPGHPAHVLAELSEQAGMLVMGRRSMSGLERMFVGSTSVAVAGRARCPVVVISASSTPERTGGHGVVAVAIGSLLSHSDALAWGVREATVRNARLRVVHVVPGDPGVRASTYAAGTKELDERLDTLRAEHPDLVIESELAAGAPIDELVARSREVDLLILGVQPERLSGLARGVLAHSSCPVGLTR
ncbi:MAG: universal stress protein [Propionicimonas sp.]|uniref:universal stress protein n=1 Tax=Propionicimonas sp. TaxID=1955623 RepID=UPI003D09F7E2